MGDILPFIARLQADGGWTAPERASLQALAEKMAAQATPVEVAFGASDAGDPWCVVTDGDSEVLIHVARIGERVVVHYAAEDIVSEGDDLRSALAERLPATGRVNVRAANDDQREAQVLIALVVGAAFAIEQRLSPFAVTINPHEAETPPPAPGKASELAAASAQGHTEASAGASHEAAPLPADPSQTRNAVAAAETAHAAAVAVAAPALAAAGEPTEEAPQTVQWRPMDEPEFMTFDAIHHVSGTDGADVLVGTAGADLVIGGAGDDTLSGGGAPEGAWDTLVGGDGNDHLYLDASTLAVGGQGADIFIIRLPHGATAAAAGAAGGDGERLLGAIFDFRVFEGDRLVTSEGRTPGMRFGDGPPPEGALQGLAAHAFARGDGAAGPASTEGVKVAMPGPVTILHVDLDGDGVADGYVAVLNRLSPEERAAILDQAHLPGASLDHTDIV
jgi:hypothetical protein